MPFAKGKSGNPGGQPKELKEIRELARTYAPLAFEALAEIARSGKSESARVGAATALLDRGYGKPPQALEHAGKDGGPIETSDVSPRSPRDVAKALLIALTAGADTQTE